MPLRGKAILALWHDIQPEHEAEYNCWHTIEHMPERVGVPGFLRARRYVDWSLSTYRYFTLYEGETLETFSSAAYRARLNNPTPWSNRVQPTFLNFARSACETLASKGNGVGGVLSTLRLNMTPSGEAIFRNQRENLARHLWERDGVTACHVAWAAPHVTHVRTRETDLRQLTGEDVFDALIMIEGIGRKDVEDATAHAHALLMEVPEAERLHAATYNLAYLLAAGET